MKLWSIIVPRFRNNGVSYGEAIVEFERDLLELYNGFTCANVEGKWYDKVSGKVFNDSNREYRVLCDFAPALVSLATTRFPDQLAFAMFELGTGEIYNPAKPLFKA